MDALIEALEKNAGEAKGKKSDESGEYVGKLEYNSDVKRYILKFSETLSLNINSDGSIEKIPSILRAQKVLMAQSGKSDVLTSFGNEHQEKLKTDVHAHYTAMLEPDNLLALGLKHNVNYHAYYIYTLGLDLSQKQKENLVKNIITINKQNIQKGLKQKELSEDDAKEILENLEKNKGNPKKIAEILDTHGLKTKLGLDFTTLILDSSNSKSKQNIEKIIKSCSLSTEEQSTFTDMLDVYGFRFPFTNGNGQRKDQKKDRSKEIKSCEDIPSSVKKIFDQILKDVEDPNFEQNDLQEDTILMIYRQAKEQGLSYIEMSHNLLASRKNLSVIKTYESIFSKLGDEEPKLRFLAGISRTTKKEKEDEIFEKIKESLQSKYVVGIDFLGEEFNSTSEFESLLGKITKYALDNDSDMVIRVHAGETNSFDGNIEKVFEVVYGEYLKKVNEAEKSNKDINKIKKPNLRIGHGIYGLEKGAMISKDSELGRIVSELQAKGLLGNAKGKEEISLLSFASQMDVVVERNITSNILLSHKSGLKEDVIKTYLENGVKCVLGTDGYGVYGTTIEEEQVLAGILGLDDDYIAKIKEAEAYIQSRSQERENNISQKNIGKELSEEEEKPSRVISATPELSPDKTNIVIAGGSFNGYDRYGNYKETILTPEEEKEAEEMLTKIMDEIDPKENRFIIGGKIQGYERKIIELNQKRIREGKSGFEIVVVTNEDKSKVAEKNTELFKDSNIVFMASPGKDLATYKKINEEVFLQDTQSVLLIFDGQQAAANLIADANKGKNNRVFVKESINEFIDEKIDSLNSTNVISFKFSDAKKMAADPKVQDLNNYINKITRYLVSIVANRNMDNRGQGGNR